MTLFSVPRRFIMSIWKICLIATENHTSPHARLYVYLPSFVKTAYSKYIINIFFNIWARGLWPLWPKAMKNSYDIYLSTKNEANRPSFIGGVWGYTHIHTYIKWHAYWHAGIWYKIQLIEIFNHISRTGIYI